MNNFDQIKSPAKAMADEMGITLFQRFTENEAAFFLGISFESMPMLREQGKVAYVQVEGQDPEYFGIHLLEYLLNVTVAGSGANTHNNASERIMRCREVVSITGLSRTTIWRMETAGNFPERISLGANSVGWRSSDIENWIASRN